MPYKNKEYQNLWQRNKRLKEPRFNMFHLAKRRAKLKHLDFDISLEDIKIPAECPVLGIPIYFNGPRNNAPSLDRVDSSKGYLKDNICVISNKANMLKNNATLDELRSIVHYVESFDARSV